ncbi:MAG: hypothetical protein WD572_00920 [Gammaproteobacteria bacterium]
MRSLSLIIPGLLPIPAGIQAGDLPDIPCLNRLLSRSDRQSAPHDYADILAHIAGIDTPLPLATLRYQYDTGQSAAQYCLCADPVHLAPGRDGMVLFASGHFSLQQAEVAALSATIKPLLKESGYRLETPALNRWYLLSEQPFGITSSALYNVTGGNIGEHLPAQREWRQLFNELQMLLHECDVNQAREARGELPINSLWFWGESDMPALESPDSEKSANWFTHEACAAGLANQLQHACYAEPDCRQALAATANGDVNVVFDRLPASGGCADATSWLAFLEHLEADWCRPLYQALASGRLQELRLYLPGYVHVIRRRYLLRFWRQSKNVLLRQ